MRSYHQFQKNQAEVRARRRTEHLKDIVQDPSGTWSYEGGWMVCTLPRKDYIRLISLLWIQMILAAVCVLVCGCLSGTGMEGCFYVLLPYASSVFAVCFCIRHLFAVTSGNGRLREYRYGKHVPGLGACLIWGLISCVLCAAGRITEAAVSGGWVSSNLAGNGKNGQVLLILQAAAGVLFLAGFLLSRKMTWQLSEENRTSATF